jgi:hypothetical protein
MGAASAALLDRSVLRAYAAGFVNSIARFRAQWRWSMYR